MSASDSNSKTPAQTPPAEPPKRRRGPNFLTEAAPVAGVGRTAEVVHQAAISALTGDKHPVLAPPEDVKKMTG